MIYTKKYEKTNIRLKISYIQINNINFFLIILLIIIYFYIEL